MSGMRYFRNKVGYVNSIPANAGLDYVDYLASNGWDQEVYVVPRPVGAVAEERNVKLPDTEWVTEWVVRMPNGDLHHIEPRSSDELRDDAQALLFLAEEVRSHEEAEESAQKKEKRDALIWLWVDWLNKQDLGVGATVAAVAAALVNKGIEPPRA